MAEPDPSSLLGDILAASSKPTAERGASTPARARNDLEDLLRLNGPDWLRFLGEVSPDDLVVVCSAIAPAWRERVQASLDDDSRAWLGANLAALDEVAPALLNEARSRAMGAARRLLREGVITLPPAAGAGEAQAAAPSSTASPDAIKPAAASPPHTAKQEEAAKREAHQPLPPTAARGTVSVSFAAPSAPAAAPAPAKAAPAKPAADRPAIGAVTMSFGEPPHPAPSAPAPSAPTSGADDSLDALFADLLRLRRQAGTAALAPLVDGVPDPFLKSGLALVAAGLPTAELERALDVALAQQAEAYLDGLTRLRVRLLDLARG